jgi:hypothetical protein
MGIVQDSELLQRALDDYLARHEWARPVFVRFAQWLGRERRRVLRSFLRSSGQLSRFWPVACLHRTGVPGGHDSSRDVMRRKNASIEGKKD